ncbi:hypothetical protein [Leucobacter triazinivorans]|uniref:Uncharacterized protein n=1 Tax=Leucobacter triazinivorans TaxID=1784719 RepID=A0A4P6KDU9_9MICO|nr:hypothetical protein [Leucobacter triazinivorans]QBE47564.1 hypothetical protein EVS81_00895 [Leucobacter triazinivorans]
MKARAHPLSVVALAGVMWTTIGCTAEPQQPTGTLVVEDNAAGSFASSEAWRLPMVSGDHQIGRIDSASPENTVLSFAELRGNRFVTYATCDEGSYLRIEVAATGDIGETVREIECDGTIFRHTVVFDPDLVSPAQLKVTGSGDWAVSLAWQEESGDDASG